MSILLVKNRIESIGFGDSELRVWGSSRLEVDPC